MGKDHFGDIPGTRCHQSYVLEIAAATATIKYPIFRAPDAVTVMKVEVVPQAAVTGADTNYRELNILDGGTDGTGTTEVGNLDLVSGVNMIALDGKNIPFNATYLTPGVTMVEGDTLILQSVKAGNGILVPALLIYVEYVVN